MFERFTDRAHRAVDLAKEEAKRLNHVEIGTEHILLGLIREGEGVAAKALESLGISLDLVRKRVEDTIGRGQGELPTHIPFTPRAKKSLELSLREALQFGHNYIGTEHILLGLIREGEGVAAEILVKLGADLGRVREKVIEIVMPTNPKDRRVTLEIDLRPISDGSLIIEASDKTPITSVKSIRLIGLDGITQEYDIDWSKSSAIKKSVAPDTTEEE